MGTSASSKGPGSGVPFDPPWLDNIAPELPGEGIQPGEQGVNKDNGNQENNQPNPPFQPAEQPDLAPSRRFQNARRHLADFVSTGNQGSLRSALGNYSRTGMGGSRNVARRMRTSTKSASNLFRVLQSAREGTDQTVNQWVVSLAARNADAWEIVDEIIRFVAPDGGSPEETSSRDSMAQAMEDLLETNPNIDLLHLEDNNIWTLVESFLSHEAFNRLCLDIGQNFENSKLSPRDRVLRMNEMRDYLRAELSTQIERLRQQTPNASSKQLQTVLQAAIENTFTVYEGSL